MKFTILLKSEDDSTAPLIVSKIERTGPLNAATLGISLAESKRLLARVQQELVESQLNSHTEEQRICIRCGSRQTLKDYHSVHFKSLFGSVTVRVARLNVCLCDGQPARAQTVQITGLEHWVSPELEFIQSQLAATIPYARTAKLLELLLPVTAGNAPSTVRRHALSVGQRLESELQEPVEPGPVERSKAKTDPVTVVGLDSGYVHDCRPDSEGSFLRLSSVAFSVKNKGSRSLGFVRTIDSNHAASDRLMKRLCELGPMTDDVTVLTDGDPGLRGLLMSALPKATHILERGVDG